MHNNFKQHIENLFQQNKKFSDNEGNLDVNLILESIDKIDTELIKVLLSDEKVKEHFFMKIDDAYVLEQNKLLEFFMLNDYMKNGSFTSYTNKIGLIKKDSFIKKFDDVVLAWPHKDCILEGGQSKDEDKSKEVFYNEILASDEVDRLFEPKVLTKIKRYSKDAVVENPTIDEDDNLIIKGNNLLALHSLKKKYAGKVKLIYIDPPYNTGNDSFKYNDNFNHSTWLTFMKNRLEVAREFLSDDGSIFINLDENESHYLKILLDEIFGKEKFMNEIIWRYRTYQGQVKEFFPRKHDTIFWYINKIRPKFEISYQNNYKDTVDYERWNSYFIDEKIIYPNYPKTDSRFKAYLDKYIKENGNPKNGDVIYQVKGYIVDDVWEDIKAIDAKDKTQKVEFGGGQKPEELIERIIHSVTQSNDIVMDYHLGSGTTCAVAHKMGRRYIGIEQMDYIEDIAVERLKKVCNGEQGGISKSVEWSGGGEFVYAELKTIDNFKNSKVQKLNQTMQYLPISELEDADYGVSDEEIAINKAFYGLENE